MSVAEVLRNRIYNNHKFLLSKIEDSTQAGDLSVPTNCDGYGRIHHFRRTIDPLWIDDPLPLDPACHALGVDDVDTIETQVFQLAACNVHCWYCFVPDSLKCADLKLSKWFTAEEMVHSYLREAPNIRVMDLSGGNPELAPEWILDSMKTLERLGKTDYIYLWSDDTLTTDFFFELDKSDIKYMTSYPMYGKVCCFKGFDEESFAFNSGLSPMMYEGQFERFLKYLDFGFDVYAYVTLTCSNTENIHEKINSFVTRLQKIHPLLPLRTIPLKIMMFTPTQSRMNKKYQEALENQMVAVKAWKELLKENYSEELMNKKIYDIKLH